MFSLKYEPEYNKFKNGTLIFKCNLNPTNINMKQFLKFLPLLMVLVTVSCNKDDGPVDPQEPSAEDLENQILDANFVSDNVVIAGATTITGEIPIPDGELFTDFTGADSTALLNEGFKIDLNNIQARGAYLRFRTISRSAAKSYFDIDIASNLSGKLQSISNAIASKTSLNESAIDIDFGSAIPPGKICYEISLYDDEGNISEPELICIAIQSWGGNDALVADWNLEKQEFTFDGMTTVLEPGTEQCDLLSTVECVDQGAVTAANDCKTTDSFDVTFNKDGTFSFESNGNKRDLDFDETRTSCEAAYVVYEDIESSEGFWAYAEKENRLTLVEYEYDNTDRGEREFGTRVPGEGRIIFDGDIVVNGNSLVISNDDGENSFKIYLKN